jgi:hypothetical protein
MRSRLTIALLIILGTTIIAAGTHAFADGLDPSAALHPADIAVTLETDKKVYRVGEDVMLKITVSNVGSVALRVFFSGPHNDSRLTVRDENGVVLAPNMSPDGPMFNTSGTVTDFPLQPGEAVVDAHLALGMPAGFTEGSGFVPSHWWGYAFKQPGLYTITAVRVLGLKEFSPPSEPVVITVNR